MSGFCPKPWLAKNKKTRYNSNMKLRIFTTKLKDEKTEAKAVEYIEKKIFPLKRFVARLEGGGEVQMDVEVSRSIGSKRRGEVYYAEANLSLPKKMLRAENYNANINAAIDGMKDTLKAEIIKYKEIYITQNTRKKKKEEIRRKTGEL